MWPFRRSTQNGLENEIAFHIEERVRDLIQTGLSEPEARRRVRHEFGGAQQVGEQCRDARPGRWLDLLAADLRDSLRAIRKRPALTLTIVATIGICTALNTSVFTVVDSLLLRPLPFDQAGRLIVLANQYPKAGITDQEESAAGDYFERSQAVDTLSSQAIYQMVSYPVDHGGGVTQVRGVSVTPSFFDVLRVRPAQGRFFDLAESEPGKDLAVVLTDGFWRERFGGQPALGSQIRIDGRVRTVVGILPPGFRFMTSGARYFVPLALSPEEKRARHSNNYRYLARLRDGATIEQVRAQVDALNLRALDLLPQVKHLILESGFYTHIEPLQSWIMRHVRPSLRLLWAGALLVLLAGAANLAGLSLARAHARTPETATRLALGATGADLVRRAVVDGLVQALAGGAVGVAAGTLLLRALDRSLLPGAVEIEVSPLVAVYAMGGAILAGLLASLVSLAPALSKTGLRPGARGVTGRGLLLRRVFVIAQVAFAFVLAGGAALLTVSLRELLWTATTHLPRASHPRNEDLLQSADRIVRGLAGIPTVSSAGGASNLPFATSFNDIVVMADGYVPKVGESVVSPIQFLVTPGFMETLALQPIHGRLFEDRDTSGSARPVVVDERLARRFWPAQNPVGKKMYFPGAPPDFRMTVVGVVRSIRLKDLAGSGNPNGVYFRPWSAAPTRRFSFVWRGPDATVPAVRREFARLSPGTALFELASMAERRDGSLSARRTAHGLVLLFAGVAALLTALGLHGLLAFLVSQRRREIGIRLAIGCAPGRIFTGVLADGAALSGIGLLVGTVLAASLTPWIASQLYGVAPLDAPVLLAVAILIGAISIAATILPALRASRVDPIHALREN